MKNSTKNAVAKARKEILDIVEMAYGDSQRWPFVRARILKVFGRNGLEGLFHNTIAMRSNYEELGCNFKGVK